MKYLSVFAGLLATGCCSSNTAPVYLETTLARLELPERPTRVARLSGGLSGSVYYVLSPDQVAAAPAVADSRIETQDPGGTCNDEAEDGMLGRIDVCLGKRVAFGYSRRDAGPPMGHIMLYLAGPERERAKKGDFSLALSGAWGRDDHHFRTGDANGDEYVTRVERRERDLGVIFGLRAAKWAMLYGGPYWLKTAFDLRHARPGAAAQDSSGDITANGWHVGLGLFSGRHSSWLLEYSAASVHAGQEDESVDHGSLSYQVEFWGKAPPPRRVPAPKRPAPPAEESAG